MMTQVIRVDKFKPYPHQKVLIEALEGGYKRIILLAHRRSGKDVCAVNALFRCALREVGSYGYFLPTYSGARRVIFDAILNDGSKMLDFIDPALIKRKLEQTMTIELINGSQIFFAGADSFDRLMGINLKGCVFSEAALMSDRAWAYFSPIIIANGGWAVFVSTPRGHSWFYDLWCLGKENSDVWFTYCQTIKDTGLISEETIAADIARGEYSFEHAQQEFFCSFSSSVEATYYGKYMELMRSEGRIGQYAYDNSLPVHCAVDLGFRDTCVFIFFQLRNNMVYIIDCYAANGEGLEHYAKMLQQKQYVYGTLIAPHDLRQHSLSTGNTRWSKFHELGYTFQICIQTSVENGIEAVRTILPRVCINENGGKNKELIKALENYRATRVDVNGSAISRPKHDLYSNYADALRYAALMIPSIRQGGSMSPQQLQKLRQEAGVPTRAQGSAFENTWR
jgi:phage terminase large subunit